MPSRAGCIFRYQLISRVDSVLSLFHSDRLCSLHICGKYAPAFNGERDVLPLRSPTPYSVCMPAGIHGAVVANERRLTVAATHVHACHARSNVIARAATRGCSTTHNSLNNTAAQPSPIGSTPLGGIADGKSHRDGPTACPANPPRWPKPVLSL